MFAVRLLHPATRWIAAGASQAVGQHEGSFPLSAKADLDENLPPSSLSTELGLDEGCYPCTTALNAEVGLNVGFAPSSATGYQAKSLFPLIAAMGLDEGWVPEGWVPLFEAAGLDEGWLPLFVTVGPESGLVPLS